MYLARPAGVEPTTYSFGNCHSIQMSYGRYASFTLKKNLSNQYSTQPNLRIPYVKARSIAFFVYAVQHSGRSRRYCE